MPQDSSDGIIQGLARPGGIGRSGQTAFPSMEGRDTDFIRNLPSTEITGQQRQDLNILILRADLPRLDLDINFDFGSDSPARQSEGLIHALAMVLQSPELAASRILIAGHTDGVGSPQSNQRLSERRAKAVRKILMERYAIAPSRLIAAGFGAERLKDSLDPAASVNRRVEFVNLGHLP